MNSLIQKLNDLKIAIEYPKLYLNNYFSDLRKQIDIEFISISVLEQTPLKEKLNTKWINMIDKVDHFEMKCMRETARKEFSQNLKMQTSKTIELIEAKLAEKNPFNLNEIEQLIERAYAKLEQVLFLNQTLLIFRADSFIQRAFPYQAIPIFLLHVNNRYVDKDFISIDRNNEINNLNKSKMLRLQFEKEIRALNEIIEVSLDKDNLEEYCFAFEKIQSIDSDAFYDYTNLTKLCLAGTQLHTIQEGAFKSLKNLEILDMIGNNISEINASLFKGLINLKFLDLSHNNLLESIEANAFQDLKNLVSLSLFKTNLASLKPNTFRGLTSLQSLRLNENKLTEIDSNTFGHLCSLEYLYLQNNSIFLVQIGAFSNLIKLEGLNLSSNCLSQIRSDYFEDLISLKHLNLSENPIDSIEAESFQTLDKLESLFIENNELLKFDFKLIRNLSNLTYLNMRNNHEIFTANSFVLESLKNLKDIYF